MFKQKDENKKPNEASVDDKGKAVDAKAKEEKKEEKNPNDIDLNQKFEYSSEHLKGIESDRLVFLKMFKKQNIIKWVVAILAIGLLIFSFMYLIGQDVSKVAGYVLIGVSILIMVAYYIIIKQYNNKKQAIYLKKYYGETNAYVFDNPRFKNVNGNIEGKIDNVEFNDSKIYKNVSQIGSRNIINFTIDDKYKCKMCDCAAQMTTMKKLEPLFIGKYLIAPNTYKGDDPIIIYLTGNSRALPPNNVDQLPKVVNTKKMIIYSLNAKYESVLNAKARNAVAQLVTNNVLVDVSISITKGRTFIGLGYDDCLMVLPLREKFNPLPVEKFKKDMVIVADIIANLNK